MGHLIFKGSLVPHLSTQPRTYEAVEQLQTHFASKMMTDNTEMQAGSLSSCSSPACLPSSLPTWPLCPRHLSPLCHRVTVPGTGCGRVKHWLPRPAACPIPACRVAPRCPAPAPPGGPAASSASSAEMGESSIVRAQQPHVPVNISAAHTGSAHVAQEGWSFFPAGCHCQAESPCIDCGADNLVILMAEGLRVPGCVTG